MLPSKKRLVSASPSWTGEEGKRNRSGGSATSFAYYPLLSTLREHFGQLVDVIAACQHDSPLPVRSKSGPRDYRITLRLVDPSLASERQQGVSTQIFRPYENALPRVCRGDVVVLHDFRVRSRRREISLLSTDTSAWAVFRKGGSEGDISGPPLEYGAAETDLAGILLHWWIECGHGQLSNGTVVPHYEGNLEPTEGTD